MKSQEEFAEITGYFPPTAKTWTVANDFGMAVVTRERFVTLTLALKELIENSNTAQGFVEAEVDPVVREYVIEAAIRLLLRDALRGRFDKGVQLGLVQTRTANVVSSYRRMAAGTTSDEA